MNIQQYSTYNYHCAFEYVLSIHKEEKDLSAVATKFSISLMVLDRYFFSQIIKRESHLGESLIVYAKSYTTVIALCSKTHCLENFDLE